MLQLAAKMSRVNEVNGEIYRTPRNQRSCLSLLLNSMR